MKTQCPNCKAKFNVDDKFAGRQAKCPKCAKPFTIEPFIEKPVQMPVAVEPPAKSPEPVAPPVPSGVASAKSEKIEEPVKPPAPIAPPVKSAAPVETLVKKAQPVEPPARKPEPAAIPAKSPEPVETPIRKLTAEHPSTSSGQAAETAEEKPKTISANSAVSAVESVSKTALSKMVFVYCWIVVRIIAGVLGALGLILAIRKGAYSSLIATFAAADVFLVCSVLIELTLFYKMWAAIQDSQASMSPAKAVGFLFIPVFNIYWALLMLTGFAEDYNSFIQRNAIKTKDLPMSLFLIYAFAFILAATVVTVPMLCVFAFVGLISRAFIGYPDLSWLLFFFVLAAGLGHFITYILVAIKTCNAINALPETKGGQV